MKIAVYGIAKDESKHVDRFMASCLEADGVYIADTGSTDDTVRLLRDRGAVVHECSVDPWRFDTARNIALGHVPDVDVCVSLDLDEVLVPGWRDIVEREWESGLTVLRHPFVTHRDSEGNPQTTIWAHKIHARHAYCWEYPVHEILKPLGEVREKIIPDHLIDHLQDPDREERKGRRAIYETWMHEYEGDPRMMFMRARGLVNAGDYEEGERACRRFLELAPRYLSPATDDKAWAGAKATACRYIAYCLLQQGRSPDHLLVWMLRSLAEAPWQREPWIRLGEFWLSVGDWAAAWAALRRGHMITQRELSTTIEEPCWGERAKRMRDLAWAKLCEQIGGQDVLTQNEESGRRVAA